jgi:hypothetical protein
LPTASYRMPLLSVLDSNDRPMKWLPIPPAVLPVKLTDSAYHRRFPDSAAVAT